MYLLVKTLHMTFALLSFTGFLFRAYLMFIDSKWLNHKAVLMIPHLIDGMFLACGFWMAFMVNFGLFNQPWLSMKVLLLMFYLFFVAERVLFVCKSGLFVQKRVFLSRIC